MKLFSKTRTVLFVLAAMVVAASIPMEAGAAEKIDHTLAKSNPRTVLRSALSIGDPGHEVGIEVIRSDMKSSNPNFRIKEEWVYNQFDYVGGSGTHRGTFIDFHEDGSQTYGMYEGSQKTVANTDGSWVTTWEGKHRYAGGTGMYKNAKGGGTYKGKATSAGEYSEDSKEILEY